MSRRNKPANRFGCKPEEDVCVEHDKPLVCAHGCIKAKPHQCSGFLGASIARAIFSLGDEKNAVCTSLQFMSGRGGDERAQGGMCEEALAEFVADVIGELK